MAIVSHFSKQMVRDLSGVVDFYYWKGIPCARQWPRKTNLPPSPQMLAARNAFTASRANLRTVSAETRAAWAVCSVGARQAWLDYYTAIFMTMFKTYRRYPPVVDSWNLIAG